MSPREVVHACVDCAALPTLAEALASGLGTYEIRPKMPRPAPHGGPRSRRCTTHERRRKDRVKANGRASHKARTFGLSPEVQQQVWELQGCACPCGAKASPTVPAGVSTDHDHELARTHDHSDDQGCEECVTGFLCHPCNTEIVARIEGRKRGRAGVAPALRAVADFLDNPPMAQVRRARTERSA